AHAAETAERRRIVAAERDDAVARRNRGAVGRILAGDDRRAERAGGADTAVGGQHEVVVEVRVGLAVHVQRDRAGAGKDQQPAGPAAAAAAVAARTERPAAAAPATVRSHAPGRQHGDRAGREHDHATAAAAATAALDIVDPHRRHDQAVGREIAAAATTAAADRRLQLAGDHPAAEHGGAGSAE